MTPHLKREKKEIVNGELTKPMAVARWVMKYSGAGARSGKYRSDNPKPTKKNRVSRSCHTDLLREASVNPADTMSTPEIVIVRGANKRRNLRCHSRVDGVVGGQYPCSIREMTGFTRIPPAQVGPYHSEPTKANSAVGCDIREAGEGSRTYWLDEREYS